MVHNSVKELMVTFPLGMAGCPFGRCQFVQVSCTLYNISTSHWLLSHITIVETKDSGGTGMNSVITTIIIHWKEYCQSRESNQRPHVLNSATLPTEHVWYKYPRPIKVH